MKKRLQKASGFSLVEVTLALGIAAFGLTATFGLLPVGLTTTQSSIQQTAASNVVAGIIADLRQTPTASQIAAYPSLPPISPRLKINLTGNAKGYLDQSGVMTSGSTLSNTALTGSSYYQVNVVINNPPSANVRTATTATVQISWPAAAATSNAAGSLTTFVALDRN